MVLISFTTFFLLSISLITPSFTTTEEPLSNFLSGFVLDYFSDTKILLIFANVPQTNSTTSNTKSTLEISWDEELESIISSNEIISNSGGITNIHLDLDEINSKQSNTIFPRPPKVISSPVAHLILLILPNGITNSVQDKMLHKRLNLPWLDPPALRDLDKYIIITEESKLQSLVQFDFIKRIKFKVFLTKNANNTDVHLRQFCLHCPVQLNLFLIFNSNEKPLSSVEEYFPDYQKNYFGFVLRASSTDKMEGDLEFAKDFEGKTYGKRGVFASAMYHLAEGLNFTAELYQSSAGASTGHKLPNGSWVGSVGDVYNGDASFCMLCGMSYSRHFIVDICSPVTYEYIRFAIGPPDKLFTWQAIFWPFDGFLWMAMIGSAVFTTLVSYLILHLDKNDFSWNVLSLAQYYTRIFIEQSQEIPLDFPQPLKILLGFWLLFVLVGNTLYRAKMVSFMTFPIYEDTPDTYEELVKSNYEIEFHYFPNIAYNSFKSSTNPIIMATFEKMLKQPDPIKCLKHTLQSKSVCIMFTSVHEDLLSRNMSDRHGLSPIKSSSNYAFMFTPGISSQKRAEFTLNFRKILQTSLAMGLNEWWIRSDAYFLLKEKNTWIKSLPSGGNHTGVFSYENEDTDDVLHLRHLKGAFTVLIGGLVVASALFITEQSGYAFGKVARVASRKQRLKKKWEKPIKLLLFK